MIFRLRFLVLAALAPLTLLVGAGNDDRGVGEPLDLAAVANMGLVDEVPGDRQGGWTDQGQENDLHALRPGALDAGGLRFSILDPRKNGGRAVLMLAGPNREYFAREVVVSLTGAKPFSHLYLLHATSWTPASAAVVGTITVRYLDGTTAVQTVQLRRDVADWWAPAPLPNGTPVWQADGPDGAVGLYASCFNFEPKPAREIVFASQGTAVWGIVAATLADAVVPFRPVPRVRMTAGPEWGKLDAIPLGIEPGSVFDFSFLADAPAGKYGPVRATPEGHLEFAQRPGQRARFWGVNLTFGAVFPDHAQADRLADRLARSGYNTVRLHHYDRDLGRKGGKSYEFDPAQLDRLEYLFAALKRRGLYLNIDLYTIRRFGVDEIPELKRPVWFEFKGLVPLYDSAFEAWKRFARTLLLHRNPYTGLTWAEDPALIGICPINEDTLVKIIKQYQLEELYAGVFTDWLALPQNAAARALDRTVAYHRFLVEVQTRSDARMHAFLRSLGVQALLTGANWMTYEDTQYLREHYDYADLHGYWDHPTYPSGQWQLPAKFSQTSATAKLASFPRGLMPSRLFGRPFVVTEFTYCWPNMYRAEGAALVAAYAGLQDWDGFYHFNYADTSGDTSGPATMFELASDPIRLVADRAAALIFRTGQVQPAATALAVAVHEQTSFAGNKEFTWPFSHLGLVARIGSVDGDRPDPLPAATLQALGVKAFVSARAGTWQPAGGLPVVAANPRMIDALVEQKALPAGLVDFAGERYRSEAGQIELEGKTGRFQLTTANAECFVLPAGSRAAGRFATVTNGETFAGVYVIAVDRQPLERS